MVAGRQKIDSLKKSIFVKLTGLQPATDAASTDSVRARFTGVAVQRMSRKVQSYDTVCVYVKIMQNERWFVHSRMIQPS